MASTNSVAVRLSVEGAEEVRASLLRLGADGEAALKRLNFDTSAGTGMQAWVAALEEGGNAAREYTSQLGPIGGVLSSLGGGWLAAGAAAGAFAGLLEQGVEHAEGYEDAMRGVSAVLKATQDSSGLTAGQISAMASRISASTLQTRDSVIAAAEALLTFGVAGPDSFEKTLDAATDLAASPMFKGDLSAAVKAISMAAEGTTTALRRAGIALSESQQDQIKAFDASGDAAGALNVVLDALSNKIGGAAHAQDQGLTGATHGLSDAWDRLLTSIGQSDHAGGTAEAVLDSIAGDLEQINRIGTQQGFLNVLGLLAGKLVGGPGLDAFDKLPDAAPTNMGPWDPSDSPQDIAHANAAPADAANQRAADVAASITNAAKEHLSQAAEDGKSALQQFIDKTLASDAKAGNTSVQNLSPQEVATDTAAATRLYNAQNATKFANQAQEAAQKLADAESQWAKAAQDELNTAAKDWTEQTKALDDLVHKQDQAYAAMVEAQDTAQAELLKGQDGYYAAAQKGIDDWKSSQTAAINAEAKAEVAALDEKAAQYAKDGMEFDSYQDDRNLITQETNDKIAALNAQAAQKQTALQREQNGALQKFIDQANGSWNQSLKSVASDGLQSLEDGILAVADGTEKAGQAFDKMAETILLDLAKIVLEKQVIGPIGSDINSLIGGGSGGGIGSFISSIFGSAKGNIFEHGNITPFANGGVIDQMTVVPMASMAEEGPEAIMPLRRGSDGKLGVAGAGGNHGVQIHYHNQIIVGGTVSADDLQAIRDELSRQRRSLPSDVLRIHKEAQSRGMVR